MTGFELLESLDRIEPPVVIFVTAHDEFALRAFDVHALDYLLKPFDDERFYQALDRARAHLRDQDAAATPARLLRGTLSAGRAQSAQARIWPTTALQNARSASSARSRRTMTRVWSRRNRSSSRRNHAPGLPIP